MNQTCFAQRIYRTLLIVIQRYEGVVNDTRRYKPICLLLPTTLCNTRRRPNICCPGTTTMTCVFIVPVVGVRNLRANCKKATLTYTRRADILKMSYGRGHMYSGVTKKKKRKKKKKKRHVRISANRKTCKFSGVSVLHETIASSSETKRIILSCGFTNMLSRTNVISTFAHDSPPRLGRSSNATQQTTGSGFLFVWYARRRQFRFPYTVHAQRHDTILLRRRTRK